MADQMRTCRRTGCRWPAVASLSYRYDTRQVWLLDLATESDPSLYDLCPHHADSLTVPRGWERFEQRTSSDVVREPAGRDLVGSDMEPVGSGGYGGNRYAALSADLPRLAAELAEADWEVGAGSRPGSNERPAVPRHAVVPSRDLAPLPPADVAPPGAVRQAGPGAPLPGQLAIPVDDTQETGVGDAVVVSIEMAGTRRGK